MATTPVEAAEKAGMPQLDFSTFPNQIFWLVVTLVVTFLLLKLVVLPRVAGILAERKGAMASDLAAAEELKQKAVAAEKAYQDALVKARSEAAKIIAAAKAEIAGDLKAAIAKADDQIAAKAADSEKRIAEIKAGAMDAVSQVAKATAGELVAALGGTADAKAIASAVSARLKG
jgi:F-type H+-transporting ATPase subunit b